MTPSDLITREAFRLYWNATALDDSHPDNAGVLRNWRARARSLRKAAADVDEAAKCLAWALDLLDLYDEGAIKDGHSETVVLSEVHIEAKLRARKALEALTPTSQEAGHE